MNKHQHWFSKGGYRVNASHSSKLRHPDIYSKMRHDMSYGLVKRWANANKRPLMDDAYEDYAREKYGASHYW